MVVLFLLITCNISFVALHLDECFLILYVLSPKHKQNDLIKKNITEHNICLVYYTLPC